MLNLGKHETLVRDNNELRESPLPLLGGNELFWVYKIPLGVTNALNRA